MKSRFKRGLSLFVVLVVLIGLMPVGVLAEEVNNENNTNISNAQAELPTPEAGDLKTGKIETIKDEVTANGYLIKEIKVPLIQEGVIYSENTIETDQLNSNLEKEIKNKIFNALTNSDADLNMSDYQLLWSQSNEISTWFLELINDTPSFFYVDGTIKFTGNSDTITCVSFNYNLKTNEVDAYESAIQEILSYAKDEMTTAEKLLAVHDAFVKNVDYDIENSKKNTIPPEDYTAYGALVNGKAVCQGYSLAFYDIVKRMGIEVKCLYSEVHVWNVVKVDGSWYHIDTTWNDCQVHGLFLVSDEVIKSIPGDSHDYRGGAPIAENTKYDNFFLRSVANIYYEDGKWIYLKDSEIHSSKFDGSEDVVLVDKEMNESIGFLIRWKDKLYYEKVCGMGNCEERYKIFSSNLDGSDEVLFCKLPIRNDESSALYAKYANNSAILLRIANRGATKIADYLIDLNNQVNIDTNITYRTHVQNVGWQEYSYGGGMSGTSGKSLRLEGIEININEPGAAVGIEYSTHVQNIGWQDFVKDGAMSGTEGKSLRLEAIKIKLTGTDAEKYDIYYQVHAQNYGWLDWAKNGEEAGTAGFGYRLEGIRISVVPKGDPAPGSTTRPFVQR